MAQYKNWSQGKSSLLTEDQYIKYTQAGGQVMSLGTYFLQFHVKQQSKQKACESIIFSKPSKKQVKTKKLSVLSSSLLYITATVPSSISLKFQCRQPWRLQEITFPEMANLLATKGKYQEMINQIDLFRRLS